MRSVSSSNFAAVGGATTHAHGLDAGHALITQLADGGKLYLQMVPKGFSQSLLYTFRIEEVVGSDYVSSMAPFATALGGSTDPGGTLPPYARMIAHVRAA